MTENRKIWEFIYEEYGVENPPLDEKALSLYVEDHANISENPLAVQPDVAGPVAEDPTKHDDFQTLGSYSRW